MREREGSNDASTAKDRFPGRGVGAPVRTISELRAGRRCVRGAVERADERGIPGFRKALGSARSAPTVPSLAGTEAVLDIDAENARASYWHTDVTFVPAFPLFSVLRGVVIPAVGGDTVWANAVAAYATLPPVRALADFWRRFCHSARGMPRRRWRRGERPIHPQGQFTSTWRA